MMRSRTPRVLFAVAALATSLSTATGVVAQSPPTRSLLALSKRDHTLAIVDPNTLQVVGRAPVGPDPHEVIASSDGKTAYVSIYGGGRYHALSVIDLVGYKALPDIDTGALNGPHGLAFVGGKLWFTAEGAKAVATYDPASAKIVWIMGTGQNRTHMIYVTPDEKQIYTTNVGSATVSILEKVTLPPMGPPPGMRPPQGSLPPPPPSGGAPIRMDWNETVIPVGKGDEGFDVSPDGRALISSLRDGDLVIYDAAARKEFKRVKIGHGAAGILMDRDGNRAFIACGPDNYVAVLDLKTLEVTGNIDVGGEPDGLAWAIRP